MHVEARGWRQVLPLSLSMVMFEAVPLNDLMLICHLGWLANIPLRSLTSEFRYVLPLCVCDPDLAPHVFVANILPAESSPCLPMAHFVSYSVILFNVLSVWFFIFLTTGSHVTEMTLNFCASCLYFPCADITSVCHHGGHADCFMSGWHRQESFGKKELRLQKKKNAPFRLASGQACGTFS